MRVDILEEGEKKMLHLEGYEVDGSPERRQYNGKFYELVRFKGAHASEYCIYEVQKDKCNGAAELLDNGVVKLRWRMRDGIRDGKWVLFHEGMVSKEGRWSDDDKPERRVIVNEASGPMLIITRDDAIIYKGGFNEAYEREGRGVEYEGGVLKQSGIFEKDALTHVCQVFVNENTMIEFDGDETDDNIDVLRRRPIYVGGFIYNESLHLHQRNGRSRLLGKRDGICTETENGSKLVNGWYVSRDSGESLRMAVVPLMAADGFETFLSSASSAEELVIPAGRWISQPVRRYELVSLPRLRSLTIQSQTSMVSERFVVQNLPELEEIVVGKANGPFRENSMKTAETFSVCFCDKLATIVIGGGAFRCYDKCEFQNLRALRSVSFDDDSFIDANVFVLKSGSFRGMMTQIVRR